MLLLATEKDLVDINRKYERIENIYLGDLRFSNRKLSEIADLIAYTDGTNYKILKSCKSIDVKIMTAKEFKEYWQQPNGMSYSDYNVVEDDPDDSTVITKEAFESLVDGLIENIAKVKY
jgi:hypothetical protein